MAVAQIDPWPFVGRDEVVAACRRLLTAGRGVLLAGPAGVGKTRLAREAVSGLGAKVLRLHAVSFAPFAMEGAAASSGTAEDQSDGPPIVVIDDVHRLDDDQAALLHARVLAGRMVLVATMRTEVEVAEPITALWKDDDVERIDVPPLARPAVDELLGLVLPGPIEVTSRRQLWTATRGFPMVLRELLHAALHDGSLTAEDGLWRLTRIPRSTRLEELVADRLGRLDAEQRRVVELVALGEPLPLQVLAETAGWRAVAAVEDLGLVEVVDDGRRRDLRPGHPVLAEVVTASLGPARLAERTAELLQMIDATPMRRRSDVVRSVVWRLRTGSDVEAGDLLSAARRAMYDRDERLALELATRAFDAGHVEAAIVLADALFELGEPRRAGELLARVDVGDGDAGRALIAIQRAGIAFWGEGDLDGADRVLLDAERTVEMPPWRDALRASRAVIAANSGRPRRALELAGALVESDRVDRAALDGALAAACALAVAGETDRAISSARRGATIATSLRDEPGLTDPGIFVVAEALALSEAGRLVDADALSRAAYEATVAGGQTAGQAWFSMVLGRVCMVRGRLGEACELFAEAAATFGALGQPGQRRWSLAGIVLCSAWRGDATAASTAWAELSSTPPHPAALMGAEIERAAAWVDALEGRRSAAHRRLCIASTEAFAAGSATLASGLVHDVARLGGDVPDELVAAVGSTPTVLAESQARFVRSVRDGDADDLRRCADGFAAIGADLFAAEAADRAADCFSVAGRTRTAAACRRDAAQFQRRTGEEWAWTLSPPPSELTRREYDVATLAARGASNRAIAEELQLSVRTVENHLQRAYAKLGIHRRAELAAALGETVGESPT